MSRRCGRAAAALCAATLWASAAGIGAQPASAVEAPSDDTELGPSAADRRAEPGTADASPQSTGPGIVFSTRSPAATEGTTTAYTVKLSTQPNASVTLTSTVTGDTSITVSPTTLTFSTTDWSTTQEVTVTAAADDDITNDTAVVAYSAAGGDYAGISDRIAVSATDDEGTVATDKAALVALYNATGGADWTNSTNWNTASALDTWAGVTTDTSGRVTEVALYRNNLEGSLPAKLGELTHLRELNLRSNGLDGSIPAAVGNLTQLRRLDLSYNDLSGSIPATLGSLTLLSRLNLAYAGDFAGPLPLSLSTMPSLTQFLLNGVLEGTCLPAALSTWYSGIVARAQTLAACETGILLSRNPVELAEGGDATLQVALATQPSAAVTAAVVASGDTDLTASPSSLTFTTADYGTAQTLTVTAAADADTALDIAVVTLTAAGGDYAGVNTTLTASAVDDDAPELVLSKAAVTVAEGASETLTVRLATKPTASVTVTGTATGDSDVTVSPSSLTFTTDDYDTPQTVTVSAGEDGDKINDAKRIDYAAAGGSYTNVSATVGISATDNDSTVDDDKEALEALYDSTGGASWTNSTNWKTDQPLNTWKGVITNGAGRVVQLSLSRNNLTGSIPAEIGKLTHIEKIDLHRNKLTGSIPSEIGKLTELHTLHLYRNCEVQSDGTCTGGLTGSIPTSVGNLAHLRQMLLYRNNLTGSIPAQIGKLTQLELLQLYVNQLSGSIPESVGGLTNLRRLYLADNSLTGAIPASIGELAALDQITLSKNRLVGTIPASIGNLAHLTLAHLHENHLTGTIPAQIGNLTQLSDLRIGDNSLDGTIPSGIGNLVRLLYLYLDRNALSGPIPAGIGNLAKLRRVNLSNNSLSGPIPGDIGRLGDLELLYLHGNELSGTIPPQIGNLTAMRWMVLGRNPLVGSFPSGIGNLTNLSWLYLRDVEGLAGPLPSSLSALTKLSRLYLTGSEEGLCLPSALSAWYDGITAAPAELDACRTGLLVSENPVELREGETKQVSVALAAAPTSGASVTIGIAAAASGDRDIKVSPASLAFTTENYATAQQVTLVAAADNDDSDDVSVVLLTPAETGGGTSDTAGTSAATAQNGDLIASAALTVVAADSNARRVVLSADSISMEEGTTAAYTVKLASPPTGNVTVTSVTGGGDITVSPASLTFTSDDYDDAQAVKVTAAEDMDALNDSYRVGYTAAGGGYSEVTASLNVSVSDNDGTSASDKALLEALYDSTGGDSWTNSTNWKTDRPLKDWEGVTVNRGGRVVKLKLNNNKLRGTVPTDIDKLTELTELDLSGNAGLTGRIEPEFGNLTLLDKLDLSNGGWNEWLPVQLGNLAQLTQLDLSGNSFSGAIPTELGSLGRLDSLDLSSNRLTGSIPGELGSLGALTALDLSDNSLTGAIPSELGSLYLLDSLDLSSNRLTGSVAAELGNLSRLVTLALESNSFSGKVPTSFANLVGLAAFTAANAGLCLPTSLAPWHTAIPKDSRDTLIICVDPAPGTPFTPGTRSGDGATTLREVFTVRIGGSDRYETAAKLAARRPSNSGTVIVASGASFADGLAAAGLTDRGRVPVLLTAPDTLPAATAEFIAAREVSDVFVIGGTSAVSEAVFARLEAIDGVNASRIGGATRYETAAAVAERIGAPGTLCGTAARTVIVATGASYADALSAGPLAALGRHPILLTAPDTLPVAAADYLADADADRIVLVGGTAAVSASVERQLRATGATVTRISGTDRYDTSAKLLAWATSFGASGTGCFASDRIALATGEGFADALAAAGPLSATRTPLLLTAARSLSPPTRSFLNTQTFGDAVKLTVIGGTSAVSTAIAARAANILR